MRNLRVLVYSASFGAGHVRAAEAIIEEILKQNPNAEIIHLDWGMLLNRKFNAIIKNTYIGMIKHTPKLWGRFYYDTAKISSHSVLQTFLNNMGRSEFLRHIRSIQPDLIICTYPTVAGVIAQLRRRGILNVPLVTVVTDYTVHSQWIHKGVDLYIVGYNDIYNQLVSKGFDPHCIKVTGIPVSSKFEFQLDQDEVRARLGLVPDLPTILIMGGAYGVLGDFRKLCREIANLPVPSQAIIVCGRNRREYHALDSVLKGSLNPVIRFGYVNNVEELMSAADIIITKAGGLITSEALTKQLPLIIFKPIPGQEEENTKFLYRTGTGKSVNNIEELLYTINSLLKHPEELVKMRHAASLAIPGRASERAVSYMLDLVNKTDLVKMG
jgi:processive 1,2-diacylglycerol beta-glucosyltransferase